MSEPSEKAVQATHDVLQEAIGWRGHRDEVTARARQLLDAAHDPILGLDRSVCLRDVYDWMLDFYAEHGGNPGYIELERRFVKGEKIHA